MICHIPKHTARVRREHDAQTPRLPLWRLEHDAWISVAEARSVDLFPPRGNIVAEQLHHEIARTLGDIIVLQQKLITADLKFGDVGIVIARLSY